MTVRLEKRKIFLLYQHYLLDEINEAGNEKKLIDWFNNEFLEKEEFLKQKVSVKLKKNWDFSRLPPLEKAILIYSAYELFFGQKPEHSSLVINNVVNFNKAYLEKEKLGYINKLLDLLAKERKSSGEK
ncbi:MAG: hypothetical protein I3273_01345 [Candidatus Moeniiplasma glomeromycotorum]|nr:hypothetical protein [Candidatus Moeniiplasma glomeromycotorum]MCE8167233.1 hypothetical protein [Candidatus Moeniiplasma glomeromycotorum]MCE8168754.1 hypothetical protein [Candidatus Moeniiplasma glomeromycotorum]